ncbi:hypothetical protein C7974DRAFT_61559 [Boeremia exigua]|uniref:uncharacterized protein n=1 Tax=Boeremia exigua TaxID=749465 RepID=UPI001E8EDC4A|nr:uncharacterized protein C7974DRAFT_61559 [Boeremia exigua]KAH6615239.1 hypothetical protein C7974DRAFT_61559 [Boeremia exigua]
MSAASLSTAVSSLLSSALATQTPPSASCSTADFTRFPTPDVACAIGSTTSSLPSNASAVLAHCCKSAPVERFNGDCGFYCLSVAQSVADLQGCFMQEGIKPQVIFCNGTNSATATGSPSGGVRETGGASGTASASASGTASAAASGSPGVAAGVVVPRVGTAGFGVLVTVVLSVFAGAML